MTSTTLQNLVLVVPAKPDEKRGAVARVWEAGGGEVCRLDRFWEPPDHLLERQVRVYGGDSFCQVLAQILDLELVSPQDDWLADLPFSLTKRNITRSTLYEAGVDATGEASGSSAHGLNYPAFIKPTTPKMFRAAIYADVDDLRAETEGLASDTEILVSEVVTFENEVRCWVLGGKVMTHAFYEGEGDARAARVFLENVVSSTTLSATCVVDVGETAERGWAVIEANPAWGSGLNGCDPRAAAECLAWASRNR